jgi:hypothetical protein
MTNEMVFKQTDIWGACQGMRHIQADLANLSALVGKLPRGSEAGGNVRPDNATLTLTSTPYNSSFSTLAGGYREYAQALWRLSSRVGDLSAQLRQAMDILSSCEQDLLRGFDGIQQATREATWQRTPIDSYDHNTPQRYQHDAAMMMLDLSRLAYTCKTDPNWKDKVKAMGFVDAAYIDDPPGIAAWRLAADGTPVITLGLTGSRKGLDGAYDWLMNFHGGATREGIHIGFDALSKRFIRNMKKIKLTGLEGAPRLGHLIERARRGKRVHFLLTGHSKGGAEAQVIAYKLMQQGIPADQVSAYTYGSPRPFFLSFTVAGTKNG